VYALAQCTPDMSPGSCRSCLASVIQIAPRVFSGSPTVRFSGTSCTSYSQAPRCCVSRRRWHAGERTRFPKSVSSNILYIHSLYPLFIVSSKRFHHLFPSSPTTSSKSCSLYSNVYIKDIFIFIFLYKRICHTLKCIIHILILLNQLFKVFK
jgi:hypothetical protein